jgi:hypothetical protein
MTIKIEFPKNFTNVHIDDDNHIVSNTNDTENWDTLKFPLPQGKWKIKEINNKTVILQKETSKTMKNPEDRYGGC